MFGLALGATLLLTTGDFDLNGIVTAEVRAGEAPLQAGATSTPNLVEILTPGVGAEYLGPRLKLDLDYNLRVFVRQTDDHPLVSPLFLNSWSLAATARPTRRFTLTGAAQVSEGEADYSYLPYVYGANQATLVSVPRVLSLSASLRADEAMSETVRLGLGLRAIHYRPLGAPEATMNVPPGVNILQYTLPRTTLLAAQPDLGVQLTETDQLIFATLVQYQNIAGLLDQTFDAMAPPTATYALSGVTVSPTVGWRSRLTLESTVTASAGVAYNRLSSPYPVKRDSWSPVGSLLFDHRLVSRRALVAVTTLGATVDYYIDPVLGEPIAHGSAAAGVLLSLPDEWTLGLRGTVVSSFEAHFVAGAYPDEVAAGVTIPARHRVSDDCYLEVGARWSDRTPFFGTPHFGFHQRELWAYASLTLTSRRVAPYGAPP